MVEYTGELNPFPPIKLRIPDVFVDWGAAKRGKARGAAKLGGRGGAKRARNEVGHVELGK